ncbi:hypothetical protein FHW23_000701 [Curtobacterium pusillum]|uniref:Asl1-like glycosyl hydrolase catalytic domain-containing protein n=1 Tax=Curtobacterium pusillum TaxID=69373 RepID=A0AAW3T350_9MICO|nr:glycosyl hydrolase [Curtobacterium pusillum]MBA8989469.1 hypothetical protein [Curtobacterium pusillum]
MADGSGDRVTGRGVGRRGFLVGAGGVALAAAVPWTLAAPTRAAAAAVITRWGVCGHAPFIDSTSYPSSSAADQLRLAGTLGATDYRVDWKIPAQSDESSIDWSWYDTVVSTSIDAGIELMAVLTRDSDVQQPESWWQERTSLLVSRYAGRIPYYQVLNECDGSAISGPDVDGSLASQYPDTKYQPVLERMRTVQAGVRAADSHARTVVNITWKHTGFLERLRSDGFGHDVMGLDWYWTNADMLSVLDTMNGFEQDEILVTELDIDNGTQSATETAQADYISSAVAALRSSAPSKVHGVYVYELLDQPDRDTDSQRHYGLVDVAADGTWGARKQAFGTYSGIIHAS